MTNLQDDKNEKELLEEIMGKFEIAKKAQSEALANLELCENYFVGKQLPKNAKETDLIFNNITPIILSGITTLLQFPLQIELIPSSVEEKEKTKQLEQALQFYWEHRLNMRQKLEELLLTLKIKGTAFLYPHLEIKRDIPRLRVDVIQPEYMFPDPTATEIEEMEFLIHIIPLPLAKVRRMFPLRGHLVEEEYMPTYKKLSLNSFVGRSKKTEILSPIVEQHQQKFSIPQTILRIGYFKDDTQEEVKLYLFSIPKCPYCGKKSSEIWAEKIEKVRCSYCFHSVKVEYIVQDNTKSKLEIREKYPQGRRIIFTQNTILDDRPNPYLHFPFIAFKNINVLKFWGLSDVEYLLSDQIAINKSMSTINRLLQLHGRPPLVIDRNAEIKVNTLSGQIEPGCDIIKNVSGGFNWMVPPPINPAMFELVRAFIQQMDNKTGLRDRGRIKTATEVQILDEEEMRRQTTILGHISLKLKEVVEQIIFILVNYHTLSERISLQLNKGKYVFFKGSDYKDLLLDVNVRFATEQIPSRVIRNNQTLQMYQLGLIDKNEARELLNLSIKDELEEIRKNRLNISDFLTSQKEVKND